MLTSCGWKSPTNTNSPTSIMPLPPQSSNEYWFGWGFCVHQFILSKVVVEVEQGLGIRVKRASGGEGSSDDNDDNDKLTS